MKTKTSLILTVAALALSGSALAEVKIALVAKSLGNGFFEAANVGAQQAAKELGDVKVIYTGPAWRRQAVRSILTPQITP